MTGPTAGDFDRSRHQRELVRARRISMASLGCAAVIATLGVSLGAAAGSMVLVAFALTGVFDALGSAALVVHFGRALRDGAVSERFERAVLGLVAVGMWGIAVTTAVRSVMRLAGDDEAGHSVAGAVLAAVSAAVLFVLANRKSGIGRSVPSAALVADAQLSRFGAVLALIALTGTAGTGALGWSWLDPAAALAVSAVLFAVGATLARDARRLPASEH